MINEHLQRLMMDDALKALDEDSSWLLRMYLEQQQELKFEAKELNATVRMAKRTINRTVQPVESALPPMPDIKSVRFGFSWRKMLWPALCTSCLLAGWLLAGTFSDEAHSLRRAQEGTNMIVSGAPSFDDHPSQISSGEEHFWSTKRFVSQQRKEQVSSSDSARLVWDAPFLPRLKRKD